MICHQSLSGAALLTPEDPNPAVLKYYKKLFPKANSAFELNLFEFIELVALLAYATLKALVA